MVGAGRFARFLAGAVADLPDVRLVAVADSDPSRAADLAAALGARAVARWEDLLTDPEVAVVAVMTPPSSHATIARAALEAGRHVLCEKPLATDAAAAAEVVTAAERSGRVLVVDHVLRYNPLLRALCRLQGSLLGPLQRFAFENDASDEDLDATHWFWQEGTSGGILVEHGVHFFDAAHLLAGTLPEAVQAMSASRAGRDRRPGQRHHPAPGRSARQLHPRVLARPPMRTPADAARPRHRRGARRGLDPRAGRPRRVDRRRRGGRRGRAAAAGR